MWAVKVFVLIGVFALWLATVLCLQWLCTYGPENMLGVTFLLWTIIFAVGVMCGTAALGGVVERHEMAIKAQKRKE